MLIMGSQFDLQTLKSINDVLDVESVEFDGCSIDVGHYDTEGTQNGS